MIKHKERKLFIKKIIDKMIPNNKFYEMPAASEVVNLSLIYNQIKDNKLINKELKKLSYDNKSQPMLKNTNLIFNQSIVEKEISHKLLENYFTSKKILRILEKKSKKISFGKKKDRLEEKKLFKSIKKITSFNEI